MLDDEPRGPRRDALRTRLSPRHVPDEMSCRHGGPAHLSGKKLEVPVKRILAGSEPGDVLALSSVASPESLEPIVALGRERARG